MSPEAALALLSFNTQADVEPTLTEPELTTLLGIYSLADAEGRAPGSVGWVGTYDIRAASREGWKRKAGKVAGNPSFQQDGASYQLSDIYKHCMEMAKTFQSSGSMATGVS